MLCAGNLAKKAVQIISSLSIHFLPYQRAPQKLRGILSLRAWAPLGESGRLGSVASLPQWATTVTSIVLSSNITTIRWI